MDNPKAFPCKQDNFQRSEGMDLRDYFAAAAVSRLAEHTLPPQHTAMLAYNIADAMLERRKIKPEKS